MHRRIIYFLLFLAICPALLTAGTKGRIKGKVVDLQTGEALIGANVIVMGTSTGAATDASGEFLLQNLDAGVYQVRASYLGFQTITISNVRINADLTTYIDFELPSEDIQVGTVEIVALKPLVQKDNTNAVRITTSEDIEALPVRGINNIISLTAGVTYKDDFIYVRGSRSDEVGYYLEGVSIKNPITGNRGVSISQDAVEEIQVQAGGYTAEFGNANAGIVRQSLKSGGSDLKASFEYITDNLSFKSRENAYDGQKTLGSYQWGYTEMSGVLSGPVIDPRIKFFGNVNYVFNRDDTPTFYSGANLGIITGLASDPLDTVNVVYPEGPRRGNQLNTYTYTGTLNFDLKPFLIRLTGSYTSQSEDQGSSGVRAVNSVLDFRNQRIGITERENGTFSLKLTHVLSPNMFYEVSGGYYFQNGETYDRYLPKDDVWAYGDSVANANAGWTWNRVLADTRNKNVGRYKAPWTETVYIWDFEQNGAIPVNYAISSNESINFGANLSFLIGKSHSLKIGGDYQMYTLRNWSTPYVLTDALAELLDDQKKDPLNAGKTENQIKESILINNGVDAYGYDELGNKYDGDGLLAPHKPVFASAYIQDKIEYEDLIINAGLRFDYIDVDNKQMIDPTNPSLSINKDSKALYPDGWVDVPTFSSISPRLGLSFPITDQTVFHAQYGKFVQQPALQQSYLGYNRYAYMLITGRFFGDAFVGSDIRPTRTTQYEIGFSQQLTDFLAFDITGYYRDVKDQVVFEIQQADERYGFGSTYYVKKNGDFQTTKGVEISLTMRRYQRLAINGTISFQDARGTGSFSGSNTGIVGAPVVPGQPFAPKYISPLAFNRDLTANLNVDYRFGENDGPSFLQNSGISLLLKYGSGTPYTKGKGDPSRAGTSVPGSGDSRNREALAPINTSLMPSSFQVNLTIEKGFNIFDRLSANVYLLVINLLNTKNVDNVFLVSGSAADDGYLSDPNSVGDKIQKYGENFVNAYKTFELGNEINLYGEPRQIRLGIRLEY